MPSLSIQQIIEFLMGALGNPVVLLIILLPYPIIIGFKYGSHIAQSIENIFSLDKKPKREPVSYFEEPTEPDYAPVDYVVGIGDDGELVFASEKPKNDEVGE